MCKNISCEETENEKEIVLHTVIIGNGNYNDAGIGGNRNESGGNVIIYDCNVEVAGGDWAAAIGGGQFSRSKRNLDQSYSACTCDILGGNIKLNGGRNAAAIGGGEYGVGGQVKIQGGDISAFGGVDPSGRRVASAIGRGVDSTGYMGSIVLDPNMAAWDITNGDPVPDNMISPVTPDTLNGVSKVAFRYYGQGGGVDDDDQTTVSAAKTGDTDNLLPFGIAALAALLSIAGMAMLRRKYNKQ